MALRVCTIAIISEKEPGVRMDSSRAVTPSTESLMRSFMAETRLTMMQRKVKFSFVCFYRKISQLLRNVQLSNGSIGLPQSVLTGLF